MTNLTPSDSAAPLKSTGPLESTVPLTVCVVGATGVVGRETVAILADRRFPIRELRLLASSRTAGEKIEFREDELVVEELTEERLEGADLVFFAAGSSVSKAFIPAATKAGAISIDKSSLFRLDDDVPLVVPEVNQDALDELGPRRIVATPNCSTIQLVQVLAPLHKRAKLTRVVCCTYQAVSGAGKAGVEELEGQVRAMFNFQEAKTEVFGQRIAFNVLPAIPGKKAFGPDGSSSEERKMILETQKILQEPDLKVGVTCVRVPVFNSHSEAVHLSFEQPIEPDEVRELLGAEPNLMVIDDAETDLYPTAENATGEDRTLIGRVRNDPSIDHGIALWVVSDNLRTGAALNAVRIAEALAAKGAFHDKAKQIEDVRPDGVKGAA